MQNVLSLVQIGIATRNRWGDLKLTLEKIRDFGLGEMRILIFDDFSDAPAPFDVNEICPGAEIKRFDVSRGYIIRRNEIAEAMDAKYYLSLDDDSFPIGGSLEAAVIYAESLSDNFCLGFLICEPGDDEQGSSRFEEAAAEGPRQVRSFVGCAHLLDRQRFLNLGGYKGELIHQGEENEIAVRAFQKGLLCRQFSGFQIAHMATSASRSLDRMDFYGARNTLLWNDWYLPSEQKIVRQGRALAGRVYSFALTRRSGHMRGSLAGLQDIHRYKRFRRPLSPNQFRAWQKLPPAQPHRRRFRSSAAADLRTL